MFVYAILVAVCLRFLLDYDEQFPIADDISLLQQAFPLLYPSSTWSHTLRHMFLNESTSQPLSHRNIHIPLIGRNVSIHPT